MISELKNGKGGSRFKQFMEWNCCGKMWQLQMWKGQMFRRNWSPICSCGKVGKTFNQYLDERRK